MIFLKKEQNSKCVILLLSNNNFDFSGMQPAKSQSARVMNKIKEQLNRSFQDQLELRFA